MRPAAPPASKPLGNCVRPNTNPNIKDQTRTTPNPPHTVARINTVRRAEERFIPRSTRAVSFKRLLGSRATSSVSIRVPHIADRHLLSAALGAEVKRYLTRVL